MIDRAALIELFDYTSFTWEAYRRAIARLPEHTLLRAVDGSDWPALRNVLFHLAVAWDEWLAKHLGLEFVDVDIETITSWDNLARARERQRGWLRRVIDETPDDGLRTAIAIEGTPPGMSMTMADLLAHILLHERGHHGDVSTLLSQLGATPPSIDYIAYVYFRNRPAAQDSP